MLSQGAVQVHGPGIEANGFIAIYWVCDKIGGNNYSRLYRVCIHVEVNVSSHNV